MEAVIEKTFTIPEPIDKVWVYLSNPLEITSCVPGATITEQVDDTNYKGKVTLKFGPVKTEYDGQIEIVKMDGETYQMEINGKGLDSKGKGSAEMQMNGNLKGLDEGTEVQFQMKVTIVGTLAQFGSRLINDVSAQLLNQFISNFKSLLEGKEFDSSLKAGSMMGSVIKSKIGGMFKGKDKDGE